MFRPFSLAIFRLIIEKLKTLSKQLYLTCVSFFIQCGGKVWGGNEILHIV